jgi:hypothetical protein
MSKRKPATASKHARRPKLAAKAQRSVHAVVRSTKNSRPRPVEVHSAEPPPERHAHQETLVVENPVAASQDEPEQETIVEDSKTRIDRSSAIGNVRAYQAKLLEIAQANTQFAFEYAQRLATIKSPVEFPVVIAEFTSKRIAMFRKHSAELAELSYLVPTA